MSNKEVINQLESLKAHCESMRESGEEWEKDVRALEYAIRELERTAQEVPVQEQSTIYVNLDEDFTKEIVATISKLNKLLNQECITTTYQNF